MGLTCNGSSIMLSWTRAKGAAEPPKGAKVDDTGKLASLSVPLTSLTVRGPEDLRNKEEITGRYLFQNWPGSLARASDDPPPPPPPNYKGPWNPPPAPWVKRSFTLNVAELPGGLPEYIGDLPGTIINSMKCLSGGGSCSGWAVEGVIYENRR
jgi:hypothetical protein